MAFISFRFNNDDVLFDSTDMFNLFASNTQITIVSKLSHYFAGSCFSSIFIIAIDRLYAVMRPIETRFWNVKILTRLFCIVFSCYCLIEATLDIITPRLEKQNWVSKLHLFLKSSLWRVFYSYCWVAWLYILFSFLTMPFVVEVQRLIVV